MVHDTYKFFFVAARFFSVYPCVYWCVYAVPLYKTLNKTPLPIEIPHRDDIYLSQKIQAIVAICAAIWILPSGLAVNSMSSEKRRNCFTFISLVDLCFIGAMFASLALQHSYLPIVIKSCRNAQNWQLVQPAVGNATNLFLEVELAHDCRTKAEGCSPGDTCRKFVGAEVIGIVVLVLFLVVVMVPIMNVHIPWPVVWICGNIKGTWRVGGQIFNAALRRRKEAPFREEPDFRDIELQLNKRTGPATLIDILASDDKNKIIVSIAESLHYADIVSLGLASKEVHRGVFTSSSTSRKTRSTLVRRAACESGSKSECWCCNSEICKGCKHEEILKEPATTTHLDKCEPYCSSCYYKTYGSDINSKTKKVSYRGSCACKRSAVPEFNKYGVATYIPSAARDICRTCAKLSQVQMMDLRESREKEEMRHLVRQQLQCVGCTRSLNRGGLRWWGCSACQTGCASDFHPAWEKS